LLTCVSCKLTEHILSSDARGVAILDNAELTTMVTVIVALMLFTALFCLVLRLFSKARFGSSGRDRMADAGASPAVLTTVDGAVANSLGKASVPHATSRRPSRSSVDYGGVNSARRASYGMLAPPGDSAGCSRRASDSSLRSQASQRSGASARSGSVSKSGARSASGVGAHSPGGTTTGSSRGSGAHEAARRTSSSPLEGNGAASTGAGRQKQPITRPLRLHLSQELRSKASPSCGAENEGTARY
ncbi:uncharacterized protein LOC120848509, partial [Ixodes scapularis]|uniref:uncharacterized protein LOC120848509 n=1 Tax=Ixodes scapularis TaxID=6945 RepID=UPI001C37EE65